MANGRRLAGAHLGLRVGVGFVGPLRQNFLRQLPHLCAHAVLSLVSGAIVADGLVQRVGNLMETREHFRTVGEALFQRQA